MARDKKIAGGIGENLAVQFLKKNKYHIIERNFRTRSGEIDIIALDTSEKEQVLCFIEVKARKSAAYGTPLEAIGFYKLQALVRTAQFYQSIHPNSPKSLRIDAVSVFLNRDNSLSSIELVKNIS
jgi:putative endonuclease